MDRKIGFVFARRLFESLFAPRIPIHGIVRVLQQIRTLLVRETVGGHVGRLDCSRSTGSPRGVETAL